jgi:hypothetical protein
MERFDFGGEIVWQPTREYVERSCLRGFMDRPSIAPRKNLSVLERRHRRFKD